ncbi:MAG: DUF2784 family protein [Bacteroidetes bacterium]|nr:DUF2784 family protein [Bacteroidota bacterium]
MLAIADILLNVLHTLIILFCLVGWAWKRTRVAHFILVAFIFASWFILGIWKGLGYCALTDLQWHIKTQLSEKHLPNSFIKYAVDKISGVDVPASLVDKVAMVCFLAATAAAVVNFLSFWKAKRALR